MKNEFSCELKTGPMLAEEMSLRDYFAAKWLNGYVSNPDTIDMSMEEAASLAYEMADAMLAEREWDNE